MSAWDKIYCQLCENILTKGVQVSNRTGIDTIKLPSAHFQLNVGEEFPILTTKQLFIRQAVLEMLWIYQAQSNDVRWLQERNVHIWDLWQIDENGDWRDEKTGEVLKHFDPKFANTIGTAYGYRSGRTADGGNRKDAADNILYGETEQRTADAYKNRRRTVHRERNNQHFRHCREKSERFENGL